MLEVGKVNLYQISDIISERETIKRIAQWIVQNNLSKKDIKAIAKVLAKTALNFIAFTSYLTRI